MRSIEWVEVDVPIPPRGEAARDRFYVAKQLARRLGASVTTVRDLERLPPAGATLVIGSRRWNMFPGREAALERWVDAGGHLVVLQSAWSAEGDTPRWVPMRSAPLRRDAPARAAAAAPAQTAASAPRDIDELARPAREAVALRRLRRARRIDPRLRRAAPLSRLRHARFASLARRRADLAARRQRGRRRRARRLRPRRHHRQRDRRIVRQPRAACATTARSRSRRCCSCTQATRSGSSTRRRARACCRCSGSTARRRCCSPARRSLLAPLAQRRPLRPARSPTPARARRSVGEQVRRTAAFIAAGGGARAASGERPRARGGSAPRDRRLRRLCLGARERAEAIARTTRADAVALARGDEPAAAPGPAPPRRGDRPPRARPSRPPSGSPPIAAPPLFLRPEPTMSTTPNPTAFSHAAEILQRLRDEIGQGDGRPARRSSSRCWSRSSPRATSSSKACPASARRCSCARWRRRSSLRYARVQFTPDMMPSDITGHAVLDPRRRQRQHAALRVRAGRCSPTCCSPTRSTARRRRRRARCSR